MISKISFKFKLKMIKITFGKGCALNDNFETIDDTLGVFQMFTSRDPPTF